MEKGNTYYLSGHSVEFYTAIPSEATKFWEYDYLNMNVLIFRFQKNRYFSKHYIKIQIVE